jgi:hypothetical protein
VIKVLQGRDGSTSVLSVPANVIPSALVLCPEGLPCIALSFRSLSCER